MASGETEQAVADAEEEEDKTPPRKMKIFFVFRILNLTLTTSKIYKCAVTLVILLKSTFKIPILRNQCNYM